MDEFNQAVDDYWEKIKSVEYQEKLRTNATSGSGAAVNLTSSYSKDSYLPTQSELKLIYAFPIKSSVFAKAIYQKFIDERESEGKPILDIPYMQRFVRISLENNTPNNEIFSKKGLFELAGISMPNAPSRPPPPNKIQTGAYLYGKEINGHKKMLGTAMLDYSNISVGNRIKVQTIDHPYGISIPLEEGMTVSNPNRGTTFVI
jgi:hypothetical protein